MSTDIITGNDLKAILGEVLPASQGVFCELIWTNPNGHTNLTCTMGETDSVTPDKSPLLYDGLIVEFRNFYNTGSKTTDILFRHSTGTFGRISINAPYSNPTINYARAYWPNTDGTIHFSDCTRYSSNAASVVGSDTGCLVPMRIYGFKLYATLEQPLEVADYIVEQGTSGSWTYRKWNNGRAECWVKQNISVNFSTQIASNFRMTTTATSISYPDIFASITSVLCSASHSTNNTWLTTVSGQADETNKTVDCGFFGWNTGGAQSVIFSIYITGTWK